MSKYYDYVAPNYRIRFGMSGNWFIFEDRITGITGDLENGDWRLKIVDTKLGYERVGHVELYELPYETLAELYELPYETLASFREALGIRGLEWVLDKEVTLLKEEK